LQDTVLALQALSEVARLAYNSVFSQLNMQITVTADATSRQFTVNKANSMILQSAEVCIGCLIVKIF
jgi:hypothetical protein